MAEKIVNLQTQVKNLTAVMTAIAAHVGLDLGSDSSANSAPKTSARVRDTHDDRAEMATKSKGHDDVRIELTQAMLEGRMKLPARMFTKGSKVLVDGHTFTQQPQDQNRSTKFNPEIFGWDLSVGDALVFSHVSGREWAVECEEGTGKPSKRTPAKTQSKPAASPSGQSAGSKVKSGKVVDNARNETASQFIKRFAEMCVENAGTKGFKQNENIKNTAAFDVDARVYLTTAQNQKFRSGRKALGLSLKKAVRMLNAEVYED